MASFSSGSGTAGPAVRGSGFHRIGLGKEDRFDLVRHQAGGPAEKMLDDILVLLAQARIVCETDDPKIMFRPMVHEGHPGAEAQFKRRVPADALIKNPEFRIVGGAVAGQPLHAE